MKNLNIIYQESIIEHNDIEHIEKKYSVKFPKNFKKFIMEYNGAEIEEFVFNDNYSIRNFLPLISNINPSIESVFDTYLTDRKINYFLPFAVDDAEWIFYYRLDEKCFGQIWVDKWNSGDNDSFEFVASTLEEFIDGLRPEE